LLLLDAYPLNRLNTAAGPRAKVIARLLIEKSPLFAISLVIAYLALRGQREATTKMATLAELGVSARLAIASHAAGFYLWKELVPWGLSPLYELRRGVEATLPALLPNLGCITALTVIAWWMRRRWPAVVVAWLAFLITLAPVSGLTQAGAQLAADRYRYVPCLPFAMLAGAIAFWVGGLSAARPMIVLGLGYLAVLCALTVRQVGFWCDTRVLWARALAVDPQCSQAHLNLAGYAVLSQN